MELTETDRLNIARARQVSGLVSADDMCAFTGAASPEEARAEVLEEAMGLLMALANLAERACDPGQTGAAGG